MYLAAVMLFTCIIIDEDISIYVHLYTHKMTDSRKKKMSSEGESEAE